MNLKVKKLHDDAIIPKYAHETDAAMDLLLKKGTDIDKIDRKEMV